MKKSVGRRTLAGSALVLVCLMLAGCPNPNTIGVQQYGTVQATCVQASNGQPVNGALVSVAGVSSPPGGTDASGKVTIQKVPIGTHPVLADAPGLHGEASVAVVENQTATVTIQMSPTQ